MGLQDWHKLGKGLLWHNLHFDYYLEILQSSISRNDWTVWVDKGQDVTILKKYFNTKSAAIKFAKEYMRLI